MMISQKRKPWIGVSKERRWMEFLAQSGVEVSPPASRWSAEKTPSDGGRDFVGRPREQFDFALNPTAE